MRKKTAHGYNGLGAAVAGRRDEAFASEKGRALCAFCGDLRLEKRWRAMSDATREKKKKDARRKKKTTIWCIEKEGEEERGERERAD